MLDKEFYFVVSLHWELEQYKQRVNYKQFKTKNNMKIFNKSNIKESPTDKAFYIEKFKSLGFDVKSVQISYTNGCSAYINLSVKVINENKMYADVFVYNGQSDITVRISDHQSNLEKICGGVAGNILSYVAFLSLVENKVITNK